MLLIPTVATFVKAVFRSVPDRRTTEHPPRSCGRVSAYFSGGCHPDFAVSPMVDSPHRCIWRDPRQADRPPAAGEGENDGMQQVPLPHFTSG